MPRWGKDQREADQENLGPKNTAEYHLLDEEPGSISLWDEKEKNVTYQYENAPPPRYWLCHSASPPISPLQLVMNEKNPGLRP